MDKVTELAWDLYNYDTIKRGFAPVAFWSTLPEEIKKIFINQAKLKLSLEAVAIAEDVKSVREHNHYFKDVRHLKYVDVYRVLDIFHVADPCIQHAVKKLLCAGERGNKSIDKDVKEAIDSLKRFQEMRVENNKIEG